VLALVDAAMAEFNHQLRRLEGLTGKKAPLGDLTTYAALAYSLAGGPYGFLVAIGKMGLDFLMSSRKKKKIQAIVDTLERLQAELTRYTATLDQIQNKVHGLIQTGEAIRNSQVVRVSQDWAKSESLYAQRVTLDRQRADVLRERNRQVALIPRRTGGPDAL